MAEVRLRFPLGSAISTRWICPRPIEGLVRASVIFCREPNPGELIALDEFELTGDGSDYAKGAYKISGDASRHLTPGTYRPAAARVRVLNHPRDVYIDLSHFGEDFSITLFDDSPLAAPVLI